jgi:hypothetical protein
MNCQYPGCATKGCTSVHPYCRLHRIWLEWLKR